MEYTLEIDQEPVRLDVEAEGSNRFRAALGEKIYRAVFERISENALCLSVDGRQAMAFIADTPEGKAVTINGRVWLVEDAAAQKNRRRTGPAKEPTEVSPPMPAVVTKILVAAGEAVKKGQAVAVVSAMKMDMILSAPFEGVVERINAAEGDKVTPQQRLLDIRRS